MSIPLLACNSSNILAKNPVVATGKAYTDGSAHFASANKEYLTIPSNSSLQTGDIDFEIGGWVRLDTLTTGYMLYKGAYTEYTISYSAVATNFRFVTSGTTIAATGTVLANTWYFVRAWRDKTAGTNNIQVNNGEIVSQSVAPTSINVDELRFGARNDGIYLNGRLDSWYFRKAISTTNEATQLYNAGVGMTSTLVQQYMPTWWANTISFWDFDELDGIRYDKKGTNHLTATADPIIAPPVYGNELIVNGGFETAGGGGADIWANWSESAGDGAIADEGTLVHSGSHSAKLTGGATPATYPYISQSFTTTPGANYYVSFWSRGDGTNAGRYVLTDVTNSAYILSIRSTNNPTTSWQLFTFQFTAPTGCMSVSLALKHPAVTGGIAYFDDVSVKEITTASINNGGFDDRPATGGEKTNVSTVSRSRTSNVATMVATAHGLKNGDVVTITGMTDTTFNGTNKTVTVVDVDTFTYASTGSDAGSAADTGGRIATDVFSSWGENTAVASMVVAETASPYAGAYNARLDIDSSGSLAGISQSNVISGKTYSYSLYAKTSATPYSIKIQSASATNIVTHILTTDYALYSGTITVDSANFYIYRNSAASKSIYIDQVTLTSLGPTAEAGITAGNAVDGNFAAGFNGTNQYLSKASNASLQTGDIDFEVGVWVYLDSKSSNISLMSKYNSTGDNREWILRYNATSDRYAMVVVADGTSSTLTTLSANSFGSPSIKQYQFIRAWHNSVANTLNIQVNNGAIDSVAYTTGVFSGASDFNIGFAPSLGYMNGRVDGAYFRKAISTTQEATSLYNNGKGLKYAQLPDSIKNDSALKGYWNLDEKSGTRYDSTSNHNDLTDNGSVTQVQGVNYLEGTVSKLTSLTSYFNQTTLAKRPVYSSLVLNGSVLFDGVDDSLVATGDKIGTGDVTICAVIRPTGWGGGDVGRIIDWSGSGLNFISVSSAGYIIVCVQNVQVFSANSSITRNTSYVVLVTRTSAGIVNIYINGKLSGTANQNSGTPAAGSDTYIGNRAAGDRAFDGYIRMVGVINRILSLGEIQAVSRRLSIESGGIY